MEVEIVSVRSLQRWELRISDQRGGPALADASVKLQLLTDVVSSWFIDLLEQETTTGHSLHSKILVALRSVVANYSTVCFRCFGCDKLMIGIRRGWSSSRRTAVKLTPTQRLKEGEMRGQSVTAEHSCPIWTFRLSSKLD